MDEITDVGKSALFGLFLRHFFTFGHPFLGRGFGPQHRFGESTAIFSVEVQGAAGQDGARVRTLRPTRCEGRGPGYGLVNV